MTSETQIQASLMAWLEGMHVFFWRNNTGRMRKNGRMIQFGSVGAPDIIGLVPDGSGRCFGVEVKTETGRQSGGQMEWEAAFTKAGGLYIVARSVDDLAVLFEKGRR